MEVFTDANEPEGGRDSAVTIGKFDGVHSGHRRVLEHLTTIASDAGLAATVVTFDRHPMSLLRPEKCPDALVSNAQKLELLESTGVDRVVVLTFDHELASLTPEEFVRRVLVDSLRTRVILVGRDFRFGAGGRGTVTLLAELGQAHGFEVRLIDDVTGADGARASSTVIRAALREGDIRRAKALLGYAPVVRAVVVHGAGRGRAMGYPTANLARDSEGLIPADGVYAAWLDVDDVRYPAAVSIGNNPTFDGVLDKTVEAHVLDEDLDLYDRTVAVSFVDFVRGMVKFDSMNELVAQMHRDTENIRAILDAERRQ